MSELEIGELAAAHYDVRLVNIRSNIYRPNAYEDLLSDPDQVVYWSDLASHCAGENFRTLTWELDNLDADDCPAIIIPHTAWGDYVGDDVTRANHRALIDDPTDYAHLRPYLRDVHGDYDSRTVVFPLAFFDELCDGCDGTVGEEIIGMLKSLSDYPCLDDELASEVRDELVESAARSDWFTSDMQRAARDQVRSQLPTRVTDLGDVVEDIAWRLDEADWDGFADWFLREFVHYSGEAYPENAVGSVAWCGLDNRAAAEIADTWVRTGHTPWAPRRDCEE